ncbi:hypothetical protein E2320_023066 [Naja naja]|nr:hypothetical protein E2320_023066 [Naja naja]
MQRVLSFLSSKTATNDGRTHQAQPIGERVLQDDAEGPPPTSRRGKETTGLNTWTSMAWKQHYFGLLPTETTFEVLSFLSSKTVTKDGRTHQAQPIGERVLQDDAEGPPPHKPKGKGNYWTEHVDLNGLEATLFWPPSY